MKKQKQKKRVVFQVAKKFELNSLIDYRKGSIVSREIMNKRTGTVTLFAFDQGQGLSEHTAPFDALVHVFEGSAVITISGKKHKMRSGDLIVMPANKPHALKAVKRFKMMLVMIKTAVK